MICCARLILTAALGVVLAGCSDGDVRGYNERQVVYLDAAELQETWDKPTELQGRWNPTTAQGKEAYAALQSYLATADVGLNGLAEADRKTIASSFKSYRLRISGITLGYDDPLRAQVRVVHLEGVCAGGTEGKQWRDPDFHVMDGGACYFDAFYDPISKKIAGLYAHGLA
jgi:hypothetical protein